MPPPPPLPQSALPAPPTTNYDDIPEVRWGSSDPHDYDSVVSAGGADGGGDGMLAVAEAGAGGGADDPSSSSPPSTSPHHPPSPPHDYSSSSLPVAVPLPGSVSNLDDDDCGAHHHHPGGEDGATMAVRGRDCDAEAAEIEMGGVDDDGIVDDADVGRSRPHDDDGCIVVGSTSSHAAGTATIPTPPPPAFAPLDPTPRDGDYSNPTVIATVVPAAAAETETSSEEVTTGTSAPASQVSTSNSRDDGAADLPPNAAAADLDEASAAGSPAREGTRAAPPQATAIAEDGDVPPLDNDGHDSERTGSPIPVQRRRRRRRTASTTTTTQIRVDCPICLDSFLVIDGGEGDGDDDGSHGSSTTVDDSYDPTDDDRGEDDEGKWPENTLRGQRGDNVDASSTKSSSSSSGFLRGTSFDSSSDASDCPHRAPPPTSERGTSPRRKKKHLLFRLSACRHVMCAPCLSAHCRSVVLGGGHDVRCCHPVTTTAKAAVEGNDDGGGGDGGGVGGGRPYQHRCCDVSLAEDDVRTLLLVTAEGDGGGGGGGCGAGVDWAGLEVGGRRRWDGDDPRDHVDTPDPEVGGCSSEAKEVVGEGGGLTASTPSKRLPTPLPDILVRYERFRFDAIHGDACRRCPKCDAPHIFAMIDEDEEDEDDEGGCAAGTGGSMSGVGDDDDGPTTIGGDDVDVDLEMGILDGGGVRKSHPPGVFGFGPDSGGAGASTAAPRCPDADAHPQVDADPELGPGRDDASGGGGGGGDGGGDGGDVGGDDWVIFTVPFAPAAAQSDEVTTVDDVASFMDVFDPSNSHLCQRSPSSPAAVTTGAGGGRGFDGDDGGEPSLSPQSSFPRAPLSSPGIQQLDGRTGGATSGGEGERCGRGGNRAAASSPSPTDAESVGSTRHVGNSSSGVDMNSSPLHLSASSPPCGPVPIGGGKSNGRRRGRMKLTRKRKRGAPMKSSTGATGSRPPPPPPRGDAERPQPPVPSRRRRRRRPATPMVTCRKCGTEFCYHHSNAHPGRTCHEYETERSHAADDRRKSEAYIRARTKPCPSCGIGVQKAGGCNQMKCPGCDTNFCWLCLAIVDDGTFPAHFQWWNLGGCPNMQLHEGGEPSRFDVFSRRALAVAQLVLVGLPSVVLAVVSSILCCCLVPGMGGNNRDRATNCVSCWGNVITAVAFIPLALLGCIGSAVLWMATRAFRICVDCVGRVKRRWSEGVSCGGIGGDGITGAVEGGGGKDGLGVGLGLGLGLSSSPKGSALAARADSEGS